MHAHSLVASKCTNVCIYTCEKKLLAMWRTGKQTKQQRWTDRSEFL